MAADRWAGAALALCLAAVAGCAPPPREEPAPGLSIVELLGGGSGDFARALEPRPFRFPDDHGPHPDFRTEWWYFTGNLSTREGRELGYQLTFFRSALAAEPTPRDSDWSASQAYMAHFALSAPGGEPGGFFSFERFARGAAGLAGAEAAPFRVWLEDWSAEGGGAIPPLRLRAAGDGAAIDLELAPGKPPVLQGDRGLSQKGRQPGNASYYYSFTRLPTRGRVEIGGEPLEVSGLSWMDREWSTSSLDDDLVGWDWFALQLDDGRDLMVYQLRREDGSPGPQSAGTLVAEDGGKTALAPDDYEIEVLARWRSPQTGRTYPARWRVRVPSEELELEVRPLLADQELDHSFTYWEGAVRFTGSAGERPAAGRGYVELTGY